MKRILILLLLSLPGVAIAQPNELTLMKVNAIDPYTFTEYGNSYYVNTSVQRTRALTVQVNKYNKVTHQFLQSVHLVGDSIVTDSVLSPFSQYVQPVGDKIFYVFQWNYPNSSQNPKPLDAISVVAIDTNLNVVIPSKRIKITYPKTSRFEGCHLQTVTAQGNRLMIGYRADDTLSTLGSLARFLLVDLNGDVIKDSIAGSRSVTLAPLHGQLYEIAPYQNWGYIIVGSGMSNPNNNGFAIADSNMIVKDSFDLDPFPKSAGAYAGVYYKVPNLVSLPTGSIIAGREFVTTKAPSGVLTGQSLTALSKLYASTRFSFDSTVVYPGQDSNDMNYFTPRSFQNLAYNPVDNRLYYANTNGLSNQYWFSTCIAPPNYVQVICADTNLHTYWRKFILPSQAECSRISRVVLPSGRAGIDIVGTIGDQRWAPNDSDYYVSFLYHLDSTGSLSAPSQHVTIRDRIKVFPNPTKDLVTIDDILNGIRSVSAYDMMGKELVRQNAETNTVQIRLSQFPTGNYIIRVILKDGSSYSKILSRTD